jgi:hypothetical protein
VRLGFESSVAVLEASNSCVIGNLVSTFILIEESAHVRMLCSVSSSLIGLQEVIADGEIVGFVNILPRPSLI